MANPLLFALGRHTTLAARAAPDADLLARFADAPADNDAFAELVRRHGPVVYRVCHRLVGSAAADDAFQATFLVLATRVATARTAGSVGGWLVGVAGRVARQTRRAAGRRARHESRAMRPAQAESPEPTLDLVEQFRILDEELARLPDRLRCPLVSCLLQGRTQEQAAAEIGQTARTVRRRLDEARRLLRLRLERRGVAPAVALGLAAGVGTVAVAVPPSLTTRTIAIVFDFLTGGGAVASPPAVLAKGVATTMFTRKVTQLLVMSAAIGLTGLGFVLADGGGTSPPMPKSVAPQPVLPQPPTLVAPVTAAPKPFLDWRRDEAEMQSTTTKIAPLIPTGERQIVIQAFGARVPEWFCERAGLTADDSQTAAGKPTAGGAWALTQREARLLSALIRAESDKDSLTRPQLATMDGQAARVNIGQQVEVVTEMEASTRDGATVYTPKVRKIDLGATLMVTPKISADGKYVTLKVEVENASLAGATVQMPVTPMAGENRSGKTLQVLAAGGLNVEHMSATVAVPDSGTAVVCGPAGSTSQGGQMRPTEMVWLLTARVVKAQR